MGVAFSSLWSSLFGQKELKICILGLDNAGKTTLTYQMTLGQAVATAPTVGSNTESFTFKNLRFLLWDVGGQASLRASWTSYLANTDAVVFVFDSTDGERVGLAREELHRVAGDEVDEEEIMACPVRDGQRSVLMAYILQQITKAPILVFANKQDVAGCLTPADISEALSLTTLQLQNWHIQGCSALTGKGLTEGLDWLANSLGASTK